VSLLSVVISSTERTELVAYCSRVIPSEESLVTLRFTLFGLGLILNDVTSNLFVRLQLAKKCTCTQVFIKGRNSDKEAAKEKGKEQDEETEKEEEEEEEEEE
jgi:uncharacterized membrane protein YciS (DUF1049 family)